MIARATQAGIIKTGIIKPTDTRDIFIYLATSTPAPVSSNTIPACGRYTPYGLAYNEPCSSGNMELAR